MTGFGPVTSSLPRKRDYQLCYMGNKKKLIIKKQFDYKLVFLFPGNNELLLFSQIISINRASDENRTHVVSLEG